MLDFVVAGFWTVHDGIFKLVLILGFEIGFDSGAIVQNW